MVRDTAPSCLTVRSALHRAWTSREGTTTPRFPCLGPASCDRHVRHLRSWDRLMGSREALARSEKRPSERGSVASGKCPMRAGPHVA